MACLELVSSRFTFDECTFTQISGVQSADEVDEADEAARRVRDIHGI